MNPETASRVFEPFFTTKKDVGSGLGLSTVYGTITGFGSRVQADSVEGKGTTFTIWMLGTSAPVKRAERTDDRLETRGGRVLVVDDDQDVRASLVRLLRDGHEVDTASDGVSALTALREYRYDALMIDLGLPGKPGDAIVGEFKVLDPTVATILITGWNLQEEDERLRLFDFHLPKPFFDLDKVYNTVARAVDLTESRRQ